MNSQSEKSEKGITEWILAEVLKAQPKAIKISGNPQVIESPLGDAVFFNGKDDAFFFNNMPLTGLDEFTIEMIFNPSETGDFEQRIVHFGEVSGDRILLEIRAVDSNWYFDAFAKSGDAKKTLLDESLTHRLGQWHHVAFVVTKNQLRTYVNGELELTQAFNFKPINTGKSSVGVRLNERSWFKGSIYKVKVTPKAIGPKAFVGF
ncbi:LamG domain-containing protein [Tamlana sp. I1]|uniref:LamG domain-containing protein n=1 Tax=Tamlana sp. I1 TaxID=2762061 RepID=UPI00188F6F74|nr:LamG domain-containing protein [Tamlana sp. I1]